jgi:hypothetical protein
LEQCRRILGAGYSASDDELSQLVNGLYDLANISVEYFSTIWITTRSEYPGVAGEPDVAGPSRFQNFIRTLPEDEREAIVERAAIQEFDGGLSRSAAETEAMRNHQQYQGES